MTAKLKGWFKNAVALSALVMAAGALEPALPTLFVGYKRLVGMICLDWLALYQFRCASPLLPACKYSSFKL